MYCFRFYNANHCNTQANRQESRCKGTLSFFFIAPLHNVLSKIASNYGVGDELKMRFLHGYLTSNYGVGNELKMRFLPGYLISHLVRTRAENAVFFTIM